MAEFMDNDRFPNRPDSPDFWRLSDVVLKLDGRATEGNEPFEQLAGPLIDIEALEYMAEQRTAAFTQAVGVPPTPELQSLLVTVFVTSVLTGIEFEKAGGHRG